MKMFFLPVKIYMFLCNFRIFIRSHEHPLFICIHSHIYTFLLNIVAVNADVNLRIMYFIVYYAHKCREVFFYFFICCLLLFLPTNVWKKVSVQRFRDKQINKSETLNTFPLVEYKTNATLYKNIQKKNINHHRKRAVSEYTQKKSYEKTPKQFKMISIWFAFNEME